MSRLIFQFVSIVISCALRLAHCEHSSSKEVSFSRWPHNQIFNGWLNDGIWFTASDGKSLSALHSLHHMSKHFDSVQQSALHDGIFLTNLTEVKHINPSVHIFSTDEALQCLSRRTVYIAGDSYMKQLYIGLGDILLGDPSNREIHGGSIRVEVLEHTRQRLSALTDTSYGVRVEFVFEECAGYDLTCFLAVMEREKVELQRSDAFVMNCLVHHTSIHLNESDSMPVQYMQQMKQLLTYSVINSSIPLTWATGPAYDLQKVPLEYTAVTKQRPTDLLNVQTAVLAKQMHIPLLDYHTVTRTCVWSNCTADGGHRSRFVNRMKAQMLLNNLCTIRTAK